MDPLIPLPVSVCCIYFANQTRALTEKVSEVIGKKNSDDVQIISISILGHKADFAFMMLSSDWVQLRETQRDIGNCGVDIVDSYVSLTEISEYAAGVPEEMRRARRIRNFLL